MKIKKRNLLIELKATSTELVQWRLLCKDLCSRLCFGNGVGCWLCVHRQDHSIEFESQGGCPACVNHGAPFFELDRNLFCKGEK